LAKVVEDVGADSLQPMCSKKGTAGSVICSDTEKHTPASQREVIFIVSSFMVKNIREKEVTLKVLSDSGGYLKRSSKGGMHREKFHLYRKSAFGDTIIEPIRKG
jgi:hypothetical protein